MTSYAGPSVMPIKGKTVTKTKGRDGSKTRIVRKANGTVKTKKTSASGKTTKSVSKTKFTKKGVKRIKKTTDAKGRTTRTATNSKGRTTVTKKTADGTIKSRTRTKSPIKAGTGPAPAPRPFGGIKKTGAVKRKVKTTGPKATPYKGRKPAKSSPMSKPAKRTTVKKTGPDPRPYTGRPSKSEPMPKSKARKRMKKIRRFIKKKSS